MSQFLSFSDIRESRPSLSRSKVLLAESSKKSHRTEVFFSYSRHDIYLITVPITILQNHGADVYIDKTDPNLPPSPSAETARVLRQNIKKCRKFVVFITKNRAKSRWVPWELGVADGAEKDGDITLFPVSYDSNDTEWAGQEYLGLYNKIVWWQFNGRPKYEWMVLQPNGTHATPLADWLL